MIRILTVFLFLLMLSLGSSDVLATNSEVETEASPEIKTTTSTPIEETPQSLPATEQKEPLTFSSTAENAKSLELIGLPSVRDERDTQGSPLTGKGVIVAIIDSGINPDDRIGPRITDRYNFVDNTEDIQDYTLFGILHGTIVTNIILDTAPEVTILGYKVTSGVSRNIKNVELAINRALEQEASIINISLGGRTTLYESDDSLIKVIEEAVTAGVTIVVAAGNDGDKGNWTVRSPGLSPSVITVGATTPDGNAVSKSSSRGPIRGTWEIKPDVVAPGEVFTQLACLSDPTVRGTSYAAPYVTGCIALLKQKHPEWTPHEIKSALATTAIPLSTSPPYAQGSGRINVSAAINTTTLFSPAHLSFEPVDATLKEIKQTKSLSITNKGNEEQTYKITWNWGKEHKPNGVRMMKSLSSSNFTLQPNETKEIKFQLLTTKDAAPGIHSGNYFIQSGEMRWRVPFLRMVEPIAYPSFTDLSTEQRAECAIQ